MIRNVPNLSWPVALLHHPYGLGSILLPLNKIYYIIGVYTFDLQIEHEYTTVDTFDVLF
jgi:hypothetical protein